MKLKRCEKCVDCISCVDLFHKGIFYCNLKVKDPGDPELDISTCIVDPNIKQDDCSWDRMANSVDAMGYEDQMGLKFLAKMFGGDAANFFEKENGGEKKKGVVIDMYMPDNCFGCPMDNPAGFCALHDGVPVHQVDYAKRPDWCPLHEIEVENDET